MYPTLAHFIAALEAAGELVRIRQAASPILEISAVADMESKRDAPSLPAQATRRNDPRFHKLGGKALLFEHVTNCDFPVLINAWGSYKRMEMALGCHDQGHSPGGFDALGAKIGALVQPAPPAGIRDLLRTIRKYAPLAHLPPKRIRGRGPCQEVILTGSEIDLRRLPLLRCWPLDGDLASVGWPADANAGITGIENGTDWDTCHRGRYITLGGIHTIHADDAGKERPASHNIGMYRVQLLGRDRLAMHWHLHHDGARHWRSWKKLGKDMPVAIVLGGESVLPYAATAPLPPGLSELLLAGFLNRGGIPLVRATSVPLWVPANAEIVIEGLVSSEAGEPGWHPDSGTPLGSGAVVEGPFGDHTGFYSLPDRYPVLRVTAVTHRKGAIFPATVVGPPPQEDYFLGKATERVFLPLLRTIVHDIEDYDLPMFGAFHNCAIVKIRKSYALQGRRVMHSVWGAGQMAWTKTVFVVDDDCDPHDTLQVLRHAARWCHPVRDIELVNGPLDILDHAAPRLGAGMKLGFDCTRKLAGEDVRGIAINGRERPLMTTQQAVKYLDRVQQIPNVTHAALPHTCDYAWLFMAIRKTQPGQGREAIEEVWKIDPKALGVAPEACPPFVIVTGDDHDVYNIDDALFQWCANFDASRDLHPYAHDNPRLARVGFDATPKMPGDERLGNPVRPFPPCLRMPEDVAARARSIRGEA